MTAGLDEIRAFVRGKLKTADEAARLMCLNEGAHQYSRKSYQLSLVADLPAYSILPDGYGAQAWAVILFVDLRNSSRRAEQFGVKATYLTMQAYLPTMAWVVEKMRGHLVGYRGDGLFAAFGLDKTGRNPVKLEHGEEIRRAVLCAKAMLEAVDDAVVPELAEFDVPGDLRIGVGIDASQVVVTRIGLLRAYEVTAYGLAVNNAAHGSNVGNGEVMITPRARRLYPTSSGGTMRFKPHPQTTEFLKIVFPNDFRVLCRQLTQGKK
jgi:adenylate cyclase